MSRKANPLILFLVFILVVGVAMMVFGIYFIVLGIEARSWPMVEGRVVSTTIRVETDVSSNTGATRAQRKRHHRYYPQVNYTWTVDGESYSGSRYTLGTTYEKFRERSDAREAAKQFPAGSAIPVYYDPKDPSQAVLDPSSSFAIYIPLLLGLFFAAASGLGLRFRKALEQTAAAGPGTAGDAGKPAG
ncbi:MAG: DUF3592 domain-containing protein [Acidobacteria bacterium]|nr:DUF3592 domain-containing protein [Acidobacteriota bacterium]